MKYTIFVVSIIAVTLGLMVMFLFWCTLGGVETYIIVWSIILLVCIVILMVLFFIGGKNRIKEEKELIEQNDKKEDKVMTKAK